MNKATKNLFITGVTGTLGKELVKELLETTNHRLFVLVRRKQRYSHWDRVRKYLEPSGLDHLLGTRVQVFEGDVTFPNFGLKPEDYEFVRSKTDEFFHVAALTALNGSEADCKKINLGGTQEAVKLAWDFLKNGSMKRFFYFSTAYAAGSKQSYCSKEDGLPEKPVFANFYESSKFASETHVREAMKAGLPVTIFRPSIVVGHSLTGEVSEFNVIYPFMKLFAHGIIRMLPSRLDNSFNIVPIDYVIKAALAIAEKPDTIGKAFHLVTEEPPTVGMMLQVQKLYSSIPDITVISPDDFTPERLSPEEKMVYNILEPYLGYLNDHLTFDATNTRKALEGTNVEAPKTGFEFLKTLVRYAVDAKYLVVS